MDLQVLKESLRRFGREELAPAAAETERNGAVSPELWATMAKMELTGVMVSPDYDGAGAGLPEALVIAEELG
ncbi:MAG: acyl-CoA dehydrogenase family protein, partial [Dehalococcoidia bacterium]|nr:acyl-CoA dehydrogenase family protein [Dehalococcoidia bacterium]